ncbi:hypothetical protein GCM10012284_63490 [Mangrovihabitans endophyticus]|uniref:Uncharacterized protein n=2 Tax=Mangrovihabitans endophyticus TaxID=1751298 RepID=A0A8J3C8F7_9ACTN|nr:hypothetical protein GCM10012284_63490 [Mangrovihabitans endophyticus]
MKEELSHAREVADAVDSATADRSSPAQPYPRLEDQIVSQREFMRYRLRRDRAKRQLDLYPPDEADLLPTRLGNALRAGERRAGERFGWETIDAWPRLYVGLPDSLALAYRSAVDAVDAAAVFCLTFLVVALLAVAAFWDDLALWWVPAAALFLSYASYRGAIASTVTQGILQQVAFDRHRFDMLEALHQPLPATPDEEYKQAEMLSAHFQEANPKDARTYLANQRYAHAEPPRARAIQWLRDRLGAG